MKRKIKPVLFWASIPLVTAGLTIVFRFASAHWFGYVPILQCPRTLDLGERNIGEVAIGHFQIKNGGEKTLTVEDFSTSCSCLGVEREINGRLSRFQRIELSPGEEVKLTVSISVSAQPGESQSSAILFVTDDPAHPIWQMDVIIPRVGGGYFAQPSAIVFGSLVVGDSPKRIIDLFNNRVPGRRVESVRSTHPDRFTVKLLQVPDKDKLRSHQTAGKLFARIEVTPCSEHPGPIDGEVHVSLVKETHRTPPIPVLGEVISPVVSRPAMLVLPRRVRDQSVLNGDVFFSHRREKPIDVVIDSLPPEITAEVQAVAGRTDQRCLHVEWRPPTSSKRKSITETRLRLRILADGEETKLEVPVFLTENRS